MNIVIIGGGAAGMTAAIAAATNGAHVTVIEHKDRIGKKILSTGNGRCNFTNLHMDIANCYHGASEDFIKGILEQFGVEDTLNFFESIGIMAKEKKGYIYPYSEQAAAVLDALRFAMKQLHVCVRCEEEVQDIFCKDTFVIKTNCEEYPADRLILACGGQAAPVTGSDGSGYVLARAFGHKIIPVHPALVQLVGDDPVFFPSVGGVRCDAEVTLTINGEKAAADRGELQLTGYGVSGIPVFQISRFASAGLDKKQEVFVHLNFLPDFSENRLFYYLMQRAVNLSWKTMEQFLIGIFPKKLALALLRKAGISVMTKAESCSASTWKALAQLILDYPIRIVDTKGFASAQVCAGGVDTDEVHALTLESKLQPHLYLAGELLDVDGICGGYNLQWAWSSGYVAGSCASQNTVKTK